MKIELNFIVSMFPLDVFDVFENLNLFGTCRHISHQHIHECMSRLHDDTMFRSCIHCTLKHIPIRTSSCHILYKNISRFKKNNIFWQMFINIIDAYDFITFHLEIICFVYFLRVIFLFINQTILNGIHYPILFTSFSYTWKQYLYYL